MNSQKRPMIIMVPYPAQGHVNPMFQLATAFLALGFKPVVVTPDFIHRKMVSNGNTHTNIIRQDGEIILDDDDDDGEVISCISIPDGLEGDQQPDFFAIEMAMENTMPIHLERLVRKYRRAAGGGGAIACMVVDLLASWAIKVADQCGVQVAGFWPVLFAAYRLIAAIPTMLRTGIINQSGIPRHKGSLCILPGQPVISAEELPWLIGTSGARVSRFKFWTRTLDRRKTLRWLLVNSHLEEEEEYCHDMTCIQQQNALTMAGDDDVDAGAAHQEDKPSIFAVGPLSKHVGSNKYASFWEEDMTCLDWLNDQHPRSVIYVSFGSWVSPINEEKMKNLALALEASGRPFIWVLGLSWRGGLPAGYLERVSMREKGKVVSWAPQMAVLQHEAVGCYLTHCGWNSTMEAVQCKKPLLCYPVAGDQFLNCAYIVQVWQIGVKIRGCGQKDVEEGLNRVMEEEGESKLKENLIGLNERIMGKEATLSVAVNLTAFIANLRIRT